MDSHDKQMDIDSYDKQMDKEAGDLLKEWLNRSPDPLGATVLRGHLMVEQQLIAGLEGCFPYPKPLNLPRQPFSPLVRLVQAFTYRHVNTRLWKAIHALSEARNYLAHERDAPELPAKVEQFVSHTFASPEDRATLTNGQNLRYQLQVALIIVCSAIEGGFKMRDRDTDVS
jgi:hypothetical protein